MLSARRRDGPIGWYQHNVPLRVWRADEASAPAAADSPSSPLTAARPAAAPEEAEMAVPSPLPSIVAESQREL
eukprot:COSAG01_NODE_2142_length_8319_cov_19.391653_11_plen_73_part_00